MLAIGYSAALHGIEAYVVRVEVVGVPTTDISIHIVGLADRSIQEAKERVNAAVRSSGFLFPTYKVVVNLAPANIRKEGAGFDLALALTILAMDEQLESSRLRDFVCLGELALDGAVRGVGGVLPAAISAKAAGFTKLLLPVENLAEAALVDGLRLYPIRTLQEAAQIVLGLGDGGVRSGGAEHADRLQSLRFTDDFEDVRGQKAARRALEVAAAGGHNVLMVGAPGSGKTMLARRLPSIMPSLTRNEALEVTKLYSVSGLLRNKSRLVTTRPFRAPHHSVSATALAGGGTHPRPGEASLAHLGVLFLDELPEFPRAALEALRQPIEDRWVTIARTGSSVTYPSDFLLIASLNPCPCGYSGDRLRGCSCSPHAVRKYLSKVSGPLLDRIDIHVEVPRVPYEDLEVSSPAESSRLIRARVESARAIQRQRLPDAAGNAVMPAKRLRDFCSLDDRGRALLAAASSRLHLSARAHDRILRVARTIADLAAVTQINNVHLADAIGYRALDRFLVQRADT